MSETIGSVQMTFGLSQKKKKKNHQREKLTVFVYVYSDYHISPKNCIRFVSDQEKEKDHH